MEEVIPNGAKDQEVNKYISKLVKNLPEGSYTLDLSNPTVRRQSDSSTTSVSSYSYCFLPLHPSSLPSSDSSLSLQELAIAVELVELARLLSDQLKVEVRKDPPRVPQNSERWDLNTRILARDLRTVKDKKVTVCDVKPYISYSLRLFLSNCEGLRQR